MWSEQYVLVVRSHAQKVLALPFLALPVVTLELAMLQQLMNSPTLGNQYLPSICASAAN